MSSFTFIFRTPFETIFHEKADWVSLDTAGGRVQIFGGHATLTDHVPHSLVRFQYGMKEKTYFIRTGILHVNHDTNEVDIHCLFADAIDQTIHTTVKEHMAWIHEQIALGEKGVKRIGSYERGFLEKQGLGIKKQLKHLEKSSKS